MTSTPTRPVDNVVIATKGLQDRNINILDGTTVENKGKLILIEMCSLKIIYIYIYIIKHFEKYHHFAYHTCSVNILHVWLSAKVFNLLLTSLCIKFLLHNYITIERRKLLQINSISLFPHSQLLQVPSLPISYGQGLGNKDGPLLCESLHRKPGGGLPEIRKLSTWPITQVY